MYKAEQEYYFKSSILEQYIIGAHGLNSTCGVSEIMKNMLGDTGIYFYNESGDIIMEAIDDFGMALASPQLTVAVGIVAMGVGFGVILYNNGIFDQPLNSTRWLYSATDIAGGAVSKNIVKSISKFGLSGVYQTAFDMLVTTEETIVTGSINEIIHGVLN